MNRSLLQQGAQQLGVVLDAAMIDRFELFMVELQRWNRSINLTAITQSDEIVVKHFVDSLSIVPLLEENERLLDIGSGAGLPGLAVAVVRSDLQITSVDAVEKKTRFQRHLCRLLGLEQVEVLHERVERLAEQRAGQYDVVTSRAFRDIERFVALAWPLVRSGGRLVVMVAGPEDALQKGALAEICQRYQMRLLEIGHYGLPRGAGERNIVVLQRNIS